MRISDWSSDVCSSDLRSERVQVELVSANPTGPLTVGSARNAAYGDAVARLLAFAGHEVATGYYVNDAGEQVEQIGRASCRERVCQYVLISVVAVSLKKNLDFIFHFFLLFLSYL